MAEPLSPLNEDEMSELDAALDAIPAPLEPLDLSMLDGYLVGVLLQPQAVPPEQWFAHVVDVDGRPAPKGFNTARLQALATRRHAELNRAIHHRQWFDPWVFELEEDEDPLQTVMPWVAGFATAMEFFPALTNLDSADVLEPLAVLYRSFDPDDLEDADELLAMIEELEPPNDLAEAVEALVSSSLLLADVSRPQPKKPAAVRRPPNPGAARRASQGPGPRSRGGRPGSR
ncbi:YecA/YgfB family protein [Ideonella paludis]|uniref:YecA family protein n=2 Tax=Ideonella paludis TaxID=1233411 RepID=A0ABS5E2T5_9BURK|nr:YecA family protein [Ideonella paludis]MBQ0937722.1 YecA family protein [Ideonella paludis]